MTRSRSSYSIVPLGSSHQGWAIVRDGALWGSHPSAQYLGAKLDALIRGANEADADLIATAIMARPEPSYDERMAQFKTTGPWTPARDPYPAPSAGERRTDP